MQVKNILLFLSFIYQLNLSAQNFTKKQIHQRDSLAAKLKADSIHIFRFQKYRPYFNIDQRNSFIRNAPININGLQLGVLIKERHVIGLGGYAITTTSKQKIKTKTDKNVDVERTLDMKYATLFYQYVAIDRRYFELDLQAEFGTGQFNLNFYDTKTGNLLQNRSGNLLITGIGPIIAIKPFRWVGIMGMAGYRFTFEKNPNLNFSGAFYGYGLWLDLRQIIRDVNYNLIKKRKYKKEVCRLLN
jgi:hypothetical protein